MLRTRNNASRPEIRESRRLCFYASVFGTEAKVYDVGPDGRTRMNYREVVRPGAFRESLSFGGDVVANVDHDDNRTFARKSSGELLVQEDGYGLFASCYLPTSADHIRADVESGKLTGSSFRFRTVRDQWHDQGGGLPLCELLAVSLADVCLTASPAYASTLGEVHLRTSQDRYRDFFRRLRIVKLK